MKPCPWCGRNNLDSDEYCFNCERDLNAVPGPEDVWRVEEEMRRTHVRRPPSIFLLVLSSVVRKIFLFMLALGAFSIFSLIAIWVSYDNSAVALAALAFLGLSALFAFYYPDVRLSRKVGMRGVLVSGLANALILAAGMPPALWYLGRRGYISGAWPFFSRTWWAYAAFLFLGCLAAWLAGRKAPAETAAP